MNLSALDFSPCRGCAHLCAKSNICPIDDDLKPFFEPVRNAEALVLASPIHGGTITEDQERLRNFEATPDKFRRWEDCPRTVAEVERYAQVLAKLPGVSTPSIQNV